MKWVAIARCQWIYIEIFPHTIAGGSRCWRGLSLANSHDMPCVRHEGWAPRACVQVCKGSENLSCIRCTTTWKGIKACDIWLLSVPLILPIVWLKNSVCCASYWVYHTNPAEPLSSRWRNIEPYTILQPDICHQMWDYSTGEAFQG